METRALVETALTDALGEPDARASVTFLGTDRIEVLRFTRDEPRPYVRYATLGMSDAPMADPTAVVADPDRGPRAELLLTLRPAPGAPVDRVLRALAVFAAGPQVEGVVVAPGASLDLGEPLWPGARFTSVLVGDPDPVPDVPLPAPAEPVRVLPLLPMTAHEAAWKRARGAEALHDRWSATATDLLDPLRSSAV
ncbi:suppressor of fused domain protein [Streptomyces spiramenti]|uniref:suppressor of fused domain protein n=1 Tax=Streptomyces spiramenti TaxID=2720606 RepID=UPI0030842223